MKSYNEIIKWLTNVRHTNRKTNNYLIPNTAKAISYPTLIPNILDTLCNNSYDLTTIIIWGIKKIINEF